jgi:hypothetical protein
MFDAQHRRSAVQRITAAAAAVIAAPALAEETDAKGGKRKHRPRPVELFRGELSNPVYTPLGGPGTDHYLIVAGDCSGKMRNCDRGHSRHMSAGRLFRYLDRKSGGKFSGRQSFRLEGINWRLEGVQFDEATGLWRIHARVCQTNPDLRPELRLPGTESNTTVDACDCGCNEGCFNCCNKGWTCGANAIAACGRKPCG